jgi:hypothetical protein
VTVTFRDRPSVASGTWTQAGWAYAKSAWADIVFDLSRGLYELDWFVVIERQAKGDTHLHALVGFWGTIDVSRVRKYLWTRYGFNRVVKYNPEGKAARYVSKYVTKDLGGWEVSPSIAKRLQGSGTARLP